MISFSLRYLAKVKIYRFIFIFTKQFKRILKYIFTFIHGHFNFEDWISPVIYEATHALSKLSKIFHFFFISVRIKFSH